MSKDDFNLFEKNLQKNKNPKKPRGRDNFDLGPL
jgi:hypothetical protein